MKIEGEQIPEEMLALYKAGINAPKRISKTKPPVKLNVKIGGDEQPFPLTNWSRGEVNQETQNPIVYMKIYLKISFLEIPK